MLSAGQKLFGIVVGLAVAGTGAFYAFTAMSDQSAPPSMDIQFGTSNLAGALKDTCTVGYQFDAEYSSSWYAPQGLATKDRYVIPGGVSIYHADRDMTLKDIIQRIEPQDGNRVFLITYNPINNKEEKYSIFPPIHDPKAIDITDVNYKIASNNGFGIYSCAPTHGWELKPSTVPGLGAPSNISQVKNQWILVSASNGLNLDRYNVTRVYPQKTSTWSKDTFPSSVDPKGELKLNDGLFMVWLKIEDTTKVDNPVCKTGWTVNAYGQCQAPLDTQKPSNIEKTNITPIETSKPKTVSTENNIDSITYAGTTYYIQVPDGFNVATSESGSSLLITLTKGLDHYTFSLSKGQFTLTGSNKDAFNAKYEYVSSSRGLAVREKTATTPTPTTTTIPADKITTTGGGITSRPNPTPETGTKTITPATTNTSTTGTKPFANQTDITIPTATSITGGSTLSKNGGSLYGNYPSVIQTEGSNALGFRIGTTVTYHNTKGEVGESYTILDGWKWGQTKDTAGKVINPPSANISSGRVEALNSPANYVFRAGHFYFTILGSGSVINSFEDSGFSKDSVIKTFTDSGF